MPTLASVDEARRNLEHMRFREDSVFDVLKAITAARRSKIKSLYDHFGREKNRMEREQIRSVLDEDDPIQAFVE